MKAKAPNLSTIIEMSVEELSTFILNFGDDSSTNQIEMAYAKVILTFLRGDINKLMKIIASAKATFASDPDFKYFILCCEIRKMYREREASADIENTAKEYLNLESPWQGELCILLATYYFGNENWAHAQSIFQQAAQILEQQGSHKKALKARMNIIVINGHLNPDTHLINEYNDIYRLAMSRHLCEYSIAATCLTNISREYQKLGAFSAALKYAHLALKVHQSNFGTLNYYLSLLQRCHVYIDLKMFAEAKLDFELAMSAPFPEVQEGFAVIQKFLLENTVAAETKKTLHLLPTWQERLNSKNNAKVQLSPLETKLIEFLGKKSRNKIDILDYLYGDLIDFETKLNRFKSMIGTLRKKLPGFIRCRHGEYSLSELYAEFMRETS